MKLYENSCWMNLIALWVARKAGGWNQKQTEVQWNRKWAILSILQRCERCPLDSPTKGWTAGQEQSVKWGSLRLVCGRVGSRNYKAEMQASSQLLESERGRRETARSEPERKRDFLPHIPFFFLTGKTCVFLYLFTSYLLGAYDMTGSSRRLR